MTALVKFYWQSDVAIERAVKSFKAPNHLCNESVTVSKASLDTLLHHTILLTCFWTHIFIDDVCMVKYLQDTYQIHYSVLFSFHYKLQPDVQRGRQPNNNGADWLIPASQTSSLTIVFYNKLFTSSQMYSFIWPLKKNFWLWIDCPENELCFPYHTYSHVICFLIKSNTHVLCFPIKSVLMHSCFTIYFRASNKANKKMMWTNFMISKHLCFY